MSSGFRAASRRTGGNGNVNADIDESLFGSSGRKSAPGSRGGNSSTLGRNGTAIVSAKLLQQIATGNSKESVVISDRDLQGMMSLTGGGGRGFAATQQYSSQPSQSFSSTGGIPSSSSSMLSSSTSSSTLRATSASSASKAQARKEKMLRLAHEASTRPPPLTQSEFEEKENRSRLMTHAKQIIDEEMDDVKHMNQMMQYAQCVTIRDAQILEKQRIADALIADEKRIDLAMEIDRVRTLKAQEYRDALRSEEQRRGARVIIQQIAEREQERIKEQEAREQEAHAMLARVAALEAAEERDRQSKLAAGRELLAQVVEANNAGARAKLRKKQEELDEEIRIASYIRSKEAREAATEAEIIRVRNEKEKEIARLRALQERAQDRQSAIDELRAKRYQEAKDRAWRTSQLEGAQRKALIKEDIAIARESQKAEKSRRIAEQALQEREEYMRVLEWQNTQAAADRAKQQTTAASSAQHRQDIQAQMSAKEQEKAEARLRYLSEGKIFQNQNERDRIKLEKLKQEKLELMDQMGIPTRYRAELAKKKILVTSIY